MSLFRCGALCGSVLACLFFGGCADYLAKGLGGTPVTFVNGTGGTVVPLDPADPKAPKLTIFLIDQRNRVVEGPSSADHVYRVANINEVERTKKNSRTGGRSSPWS